ELFQPLRITNQETKAAHLQSTFEWFRYKKPTERSQRQSLCLQLRWCVDFLCSYLKQAAVDINGQMSQPPIFRNRGCTLYLKIWVLTQASELLSGKDRVSFSIKDNNTQQHMPRQRKVRMREKEGRIGTALFPAMARTLTSTAKLGGPDRGGTEEERKSPCIETARNDLPSLPDSHCSPVYKQLTLLEPAGQIFDLQTVVSCYVMLGFEPGSFGRAVSALNH
ncbi:hypothetical protein STEG23_027752, partial [Scotinomys teguina]